MGIGEVLDSGFGLARHNFRLLAIIAAWGLVPGYALQGVMSAALYSGASSSSSRSAALATAAGAGSGIISAVAAGLAALAVMAACARLVSRLGGPEPPTAKWAYRIAVSRAPAFLLMGIIVALSVIPALLILPLGIYVWIRWTPSFPALLIEGVGPITALGRGWGLTRGAWWHTALVLILAGIAIAVIQFVTAGVLGIGLAVSFFVMEAPAVSAILSAVMNAMVSIIATPFSAAVAVILYYELRARAEGFDLEQRLMQLAPAE